jgi:hypothetical protein
MLKSPKTWTIDDLNDVEAINLYNDVKKRTNGDTTAPKDIMEYIQAIGRDNSHTPMQ